MEFRKARPGLTQRVTLGRYLLSEVGKAQSKTNHRFKGLLVMYSPTEDYFCFTLTTKIGILATARIFDPFREEAQIRCIIL